MQALQHRGPDDAGEYSHGSVSLGFRRLAIIDLSFGGHQPMSSPDGQITLVFNGEIYNYRELRQELVRLGQQFRSSSDTEVLLAAYRQWGADCVHRFNGMFAFIVHDRREGILFGARDRMGVKPLYFWQDADWIVLASEPGAIGATGLVALQPDWQRLHQGLAHGRMGHDGGSCLAGIAQVPAGHTLRVDSRGGVSHQAYWSLPPEPAPATPATPRSDSEWVSELGSLLSDAVSLRMRSDVPVGFTLSGGIDSSMLICEAARSGHGALVAFSYQDVAYDERQCIADTVAQTGAQLHTIEDSQLDVATLLPKVIAANGEPVHSMSAVANYALFGLARQHGVKVMLGGQGADEILGGYGSFQQDYWHTLCADLGWGALVSDVRASARVLGHGVGQALLQTAWRSIRIAASGTAAYRGLRTLRAADPGQIRGGLFLPGLAGPLPARQASSPYRLQGRLRHAASVSPLPLYLRIEDRVSMAHAVEARLPFTDYRIVEHALRMPDRLRFANGWNKVALRRAAHGLVPASVSRQVRKLGFPVGYTEATVRGLHTLCLQLAANQAFRERGIYNLAAVQALLAQPPRTQDLDTLFDLAQTELWLLGLRRQPQVAKAAATVAATVAP